jgi:hypothetical protein
VGGPLGPAVSPDPVVLMSVVTIGESIEVMSPARVQPELNQAVSKSKVDGPADLSQEPTDILRAVSEGRDRMSSLFGPCSGGVGGGSFAWQGNFSGELVVSGLNGWGLPLKPLQNYLFMQAKDGVGNSNSQPTGCSDLVVFQEGDQPKAVADSGKVLCDVDVGEREDRVRSVSPLNSYTNSEGDLSGYSDWVIRRANEIYPILGISFEGHKLQLLDFLSFIEADRLLGEEGALSCGGKKGKREVKNLECSINYDARDSCSSRGKRETRGHPVVL